MARSFNGSGDYINCGQVPLPGGTTSSFSISCWINTSSLPVSGNRTFIGRIDGTFQTFFVINLNSTGTLGFFSQTGGSGNNIDPGSTITSTSTWYHVGMTVDNPNSNTLIGYVNGVSQGSVTGAIGGAVITNPFTIGAHSQSIPGSCYSGRIADVAHWWGMVLTPGEILALAAGVRPYNIRRANIVGYWPLDGVNSPEPDLSGNANNGVLTGTTNASGPPLAMFTPRWPSNVEAPAAPTFIPAWARQSNLPVIGAGTI